PPLSRSPKRHAPPTRPPARLRLYPYTTLFRSLLPQAILDIPTYGCWNVHASLLPRWRGAAPIQRAIEAGDAETGVCLMQMEKGRSEEHTSELQSREKLVCRLVPEKKKKSASHI